MTTIKDVAQHAGVSTATVSRVLNGHAAPTPETRTRVLAAVDELGYRPNALARSLRTTATTTLGLVISDLVNPFFAEIARAVEEEARAHGYCVIVANADESADQQATYVRNLLDRRVDGLLVCPATDDPTWVAEVEANGVPLVLLDRTVRGATCPVVRADGAQALAELAETLRAAGHRKVGVIAGPADTSTGRERLEQFARGGLDLVVVHGDFRRESGARAAAELVSRADRPTALVAMDNLMGLGALEELRRRKLKVPDDVGLAVYDDQPWFPLLDPPITVIAQPTVEMGREAARSLLRLIAGVQPADVQLTARLVPRGSCGEATGAA
ncbi:LacI family DNA-binding transcriptional regulator [Actinosynnema sp. CS-041913]|uniref:LacI family DNA-binding transcriptional regulator n=1 Tax=Actinosynnema sp. CS-041913 TaxID=3239917 RepID=UPI003D8BE254